MKYAYQMERPIPQAQRKAINEKILYLIDSGKVEDTGISREDIYNSYTGDGSLHGLECSDFENYEYYMQAKREVENGQFFTPHGVCKFVIDCLKPKSEETMGDPTCGSGNFFNHWPKEINTFGCEVDIKAYKVAHYLYPDSNIVYGDIRSYQPYLQLDYVVGNPPCSLQWSIQEKEYVSQLYYAIKAAELLKPLGILAMVVPRTFLSDPFQEQERIRQMEERYGFLGQYELPANAFHYLGVDQYPTKLQLWQRKCEGVDLPHYLTDIHQLAGFDDENAQKAYQETVMPAAARQKKYRCQVQQALAGLRITSQAFQEKTTKLLYHIKSHPATKMYLAQSQEFLNRFYMERKPPEMPWQEWGKTKLTEEKVIKHLKEQLRKQSTPVPRDEIRLVKTDYGFRYKAYSPRTEPQLVHYASERPMYEVVLNEAPEWCPGYEKLARRKIREYRMQSIPFGEMEQDEEIKQWLENFSLYDMVEEKTVRLNDLQKTDVGHNLRKRYGLLQWEQGSGKTLAGLAVLLYRLEHGQVHNVFVVSNAFAISATWVVSLENYGIEFVRVNRLKDLAKVKRGQIVEISLEMLCKYQKQIKRYVRMQNQKIQLIMDESDDLTNPYSQRTKAVLNCFRRCRYKVELTGTSTRNNISESAPEFELLYNNSVNMISWAEHLYHYDKDNDIVNEDYNPYYGKPIPAYRRGYELFTASHLPEKLTVFGVHKRNQDVYNSEVLQNLLDKTVITRTFREVTGRDIYEILQRTVPFSPAEREVYAKAIKEFYLMEQRYFTMIGDSRKDSMMHMIRHIVMLLRICAAPNSLDEFPQEEKPTKIQELIKMLREWSDERVAIGVRHIKVVNLYAKAIRKAFPGRPVVVVTGNKTSLKRRIEIARELKQMPNAILLCTQQSLACSISIDYINKIVLPELHYNNARMSQFYFRFIRFTSVDWKQVYFLTYEYSIESNLLQMVIAKEKLNQLMKNKAYDYDELYEKFGVDFDLMDMLMSRKRGEDGKDYIGSDWLGWGEQKIS